MPSISPLYRLYAPEYNISLRDRMIEKIAREGWFPTQAIVMGISVEAPLMPMPGEEAKFGGKEHFRGFRAAITLMTASLYKARDDELLDVIANNSLMQAMDANVMRLGQRFLDTGRSLLLRDISGKRAMAEIIKQLKSNFSDRDFQRGAEAAQSIFLAYWKVLEKLGVNLTDKRAP